MTLVLMRVIFLYGNIKSCDVKLSRSFIQCYCASWGIVELTQLTHRSRYEAGAACFVACRPSLQCLETKIKKHQSSRPLLNRTFPVRRSENSTLMYNSPSGSAGTAPGGSPPDSDPAQLCSICQHPNPISMGVHFFQMTGTIGPQNPGLSTPGGCVVQGRAQVHVNGRWRGKVTQRTSESSICLLLA